MLEGLMIALVIIHIASSITAHNIMAKNDFPVRWYELGWRIWLRYETFMGSQKNPEKKQYYRFVYWSGVLSVISTVILGVLTSVL